MFNFLQQAAAKPMQVNDTKSRSQNVLHACTACELCRWLDMNEASNFCGGQVCEVDYSNATSVYCECGAASCMAAHMDVLHLPFYTRTQQNTHAHAQRSAAVTLPQAGCCTISHSVAHELGLGRGCSNIDIHLTVAVRASTADLKQKTPKDFDLTGE